MVRRRKNRNSISMGGIFNGWSGYLVFEFLTGRIVDLFPINYRKKITMKKRDSGDVLLRKHWHDLRRSAI